ncbi:hypothetical protein C1H76_6966 [Elsinoe australis]|uniref:Uncharacterized protein n=1 Tax=Elsinoe australis TaxID=40998 RepID=A0A4U7ASE2_9PEZI|nr:hypothetical protein C1H76_6966 [Elsinoe australis]
MNNDFQHFKKLDSAAAVRNDLQHFERLDVSSPASAQGAIGSDYHSSRAWSVIGTVRYRSLWQLKRIGKKPMVNPARPPPDPKSTPTGGWSPGEHRDLMWFSAR